MVRRGNVPVRTCVVCGARKAKESLLRLAVDSLSRIVADPRQRMVGRGAYTCPECLPRLRLTGKVQRAFRNRGKEIAPEISRL